MLVAVRLTPFEFAKLKSEAAKSGRSRALGRYLHDRAMDRQPKIIPAINRATWSHLGRWAGAFTTIANAAAGERLTQLYPFLDPSLSILLQRATAELRALRLALLGLDDEAMAAADEAERRGVLIDAEEAGFGEEEEDSSGEIDLGDPVQWGAP